MPVVVIAALMFALSVLTATSDAAQSCVSTPEARQHFAAMSAMPPDDEPEKAPAVDRAGMVELTQSPVAARWGDIIRVAPPLFIERKPGPAVRPGGVALVVIAIAVTLGTIEVLFRCTIYERPHAADHRQTDEKRVKRTTA